MRKVVSNTTPLIALAEIGKLDVLHKLYGEILIPEAVRREIIQEPARSETQRAGWILTRSIRYPENKEFYRARLHSGEVEAILLAHEEQADLLIIDDNAAKKAAKSTGLKVTGTLGVLLRAKQEGIIDDL